MEKGKLIAVEGIDGSGKSTLITHLKSHLEKKGIDVVLTHEAGGTLLGKQLRELLHFHKKNVADQAEYLLFAADRSQHFYEVVKPALERGALVISDRMADSSLAYQGYGRHLSLEMIDRVNKWTMQGQTPDAILYVHIDWPTAYQRILARKNALTSFEKEKEAFWQRVLLGYEEVFKNRKEVIRLDGKQTPLDVAAQAISSLKEKKII